MTLQKLTKCLLLALAISFWQYDSARSAEADTSKSYSLPSITVTSTKAEERKSAVTFSEINRDEISRLHSGKDLPMLLSEMPSILFYSESGNNIGYSNIKMRGFDQRRIAVMVNGIPQNDPEDHNMYWINLGDIGSSLDNIQVQRGAGLSNYGQAAIGGSINLTTANYADQKSIKLFSGVGFQNFSGDARDSRQTISRYSMEVSSGLVDNYAFYGRLSRINSFGYRDQSFATLNGWFLSAVRFDDKLTTQINVFGGSQNDGLVYNGLPKSWVTDKNLRLKNYSEWYYEADGETVAWGTERRKREIEQFTQPHYEMLNDWQITDNISLKSSLFFYSGQGYFDFNGSWLWDAAQFRLTPENGFEDDVEMPRNSIIRAYVGNKQGGWIPRLIINRENSQSTIGAEIRLHRSEHWGKIRYAENFPEGYDPDYKFYSYNGHRDIFSAFARHSQDITDNFSIIGDLSVVNHTYIINNEKAGNIYTQYTTMDGGTVGNGNDLFDIKYLFVNPRLSLNYNINDEQNTYTSFAFTQREPRMKNLYAASDAYYGESPQFKSISLEDGTSAYDFSSPYVKPEKMFNIEAGWGFKTSRFNLNSNIYWMEYFDELVKSGQLDMFGAPIDGNAPRTRHYGVELSGNALLANFTGIGSLVLGANMTYSQNPIIDYEYITGSGEAVSLKNNSIAGFPDIMGNLRLSLQNDNLFISILMRHVGSFRTDNFGDLLTTNQAIIDDLRGWFDEDSGTYPWNGHYSDNTVDAYTVFNADIAYTIRSIPGIPSFKINAQIVNLFNKLYAASGAGREFFPGGERTVFVGFELGL